MAIRDLYSSGVSWLFGQLREAFGQDGTTASILASASPGAVVIANLPCLVRPMRVDTIVQGAKAPVVPRAQLFFLSDPAVTKLNRIVVGTTRYCPVGTVAKDRASGLYVVECVEVTSDR